MKTQEIIGFKRANLGKATVKELRANGLVPCVLYGGKEQIHFSVPTILFKNVIYTPEATTVTLNLEGDIFSCILQDAQFHPVNELLLHADFLLLDEKKEVKIEVPIKFTGTAPGIIKGGKLIQKLRKVKIKATPSNLPDNIMVDISGLDLGKSVRVGDIKTDKYTILNSPLVSIASVEVPRALKGKAGEEGAAAPAAEAK
jgi:large subunit ribosomal protein L25